MRQWTVEGVDQSGKKSRANVTAQDEAHAASIAKSQKGITASNVFFVPPVADRPEPIRPTIRPGFTPLEDASESDLKSPGSEAVNASKARIRTIGRALSICGIIIVGVGAFIPIGAAISSQARFGSVRIEWEYIFPILVLTVAFIGWGLLLLGFAAVMRMLAIK